MVKKSTVDDMLRSYLEEKYLDDDSIKSIMKSLHKDVKKKEDGDDEDYGETKVSHGTSCPRLSNKKGELLVEM